MVEPQFNQRYPNAMAQYAASLGAILDGKTQVPRPWC
jgi:hypothetical protein